MSDRRGFTLLEVMVAMAILGMAVVSCLEIFSSALRMETRASRMSRVVLHARAAMDALLFEPEVKDHEETRTTQEGFETHILVRHAGSGEGVEHRDLDLQSENALRYLRVEVRWKDAGGEGKPFVLESLRMAPENE